MVSNFPPASISQHNKRIILSVLICIHMKCTWGTSEVERAAPMVAVEHQRLEARRDTVHDETPRKIVVAEVDFYDKRGQILQDDIPCKSVLGQHDLVEPRWQLC